MLIECLVEREGNTVVNIQRSRYDFVRNKYGNQVCDVLSASHAEHLLKLSDFQLYTPPGKVVKYYPCERCGDMFTHHLALAGHQRGCKQVAKHEPERDTLLD